MRRGSVGARRVDSVGGVGWHSPTPLRSRERLMELERRHQRRAGIARNCLMILQRTERESMGNGPYRGVGSTRRVRSPRDPKDEINGSPLDECSRPPRSVFDAHLVRAHRKLGRLRNVLTNRGGSEPGSVRLKTSGFLPVFSNVSTRPAVLDAARRFGSSSYRQKSVGDFLRAWPGSPSGLSFFGHHFSSSRLRSDLVKDTR